MKRAERGGGGGMCTSSAEPHPHSKFQPCRHFLSLHLLPCHFSLVTPPTSHFLPAEGTKLSHPPTLPVSLPSHASCPPPPPLCTPAPSSVISFPLFFCTPTSLEREAAAAT